MLAIAQQLFDRFPVAIGDPVARPAPVPKPIRVVLELVQVELAVRRERALVPGAVVVRRKREVLADVEGHDDRGALVLVARHVLAVAQVVDDADPLRARPEMDPGGEGGPILSARTIRALGLDHGVERTVKLDFDDGVLIEARGEQLTVLPDLRSHGTLQDPRPVGARRGRVHAQLVEQGKLSLVDDGLQLAGVHGDPRGRLGDLELPRRSRHRLRARDGANPVAPALGPHEVQV